MPRDKDGQPGNDAYIMRDAFRRCAYNIGVETQRITMMMATPLWSGGVRRMPRAAYDDLRMARRQLNEASAAIAEILLLAADREEVS